MNSGEYVLMAIPYIIRRSTHRENVIKIRQMNGMWISIDTNESAFDSHKVCRKSQFQKFIFLRRINVLLNVD